MYLFRNVIYGTEAQAGLFYIDGMLFLDGLYLFTLFPKCLFLPFVE